MACFSACNSSHRASNKLIFTTRKNHKDFPGLPIVLLENWGSGDAKKERRGDWGWGHRKKKKSGKDVMDWNEGEDWFEVRQDSVEVGRGKGREKEGGSGTQKKRHTFRAYLHVAASMTGNLGKFSTESAADGEGIKTKAESKREKKGKGRREGGEWGNKHWRGRVQTTWHGLSWVWEQDSKWVSRFQSEKRSGMWGRGYRDGRMRVCWKD